MPDQCPVCGRTYATYSEGHTPNGEICLRNQLESRNRAQESLRRDKERLDWLQTNKQGVEMLAGYFRVYIGHQKKRSTDIRRLKIREAIDAAMSGKEKK